MIEKNKHERVCTSKIKKESKLKKSKKLETTTPRDTQWKQREEVRQRSEINPTAAGALRKTPLLLSLSLSLSHHPPHWLPHYRSPFAYCTFVSTLDLYSITTVKHVRSNLSVVSSHVMAVRRLFESSTFALRPSFRPSSLLSTTLYRSPSNRLKLSPYPSSA